MLFSGKKRSGAASALALQAKSTRDALRSFKEFAQDASGEAVARLRARLAKADASGLKAIEAFGAEKGRFPPEASDAVRRVGEIGESLRRCVDEMERFSVPADDAIRSIAEALAGAGEELALAAAAFGGPGDGLAEAVVRTKRWANLAASRVRDATAALLAGGEVVEVLKTREIHKHLSEAAERADDAADLLGDAEVKGR